MTTRCLRRLHGMTVLDCTDNVGIRNQLNAGCFARKTPLISGAAIRMEGQISVLPTLKESPATAA